MSKYEHLSKEIIKNVGGKDNVTALVHCVTRLRFTIKNMDLVNDNKIKNMEGVVTAINSGGQYQVVIGTHVTEVYEEVINKLGLKESESTEGAEKKGILKGILDIVSNVFTPILSILCASGLIKGLNVLAQFLGLYAKDSSYYVLFNSIGDTLFYFFPVFLGYTSAKKFKMKPMLGMAIGAVLCYPALNGSEMTFFGHVMKVTYTSTVLPIIFICALAAPLEKFFTKKLPTSIKSFMAPMLTLLIVVPIGYTLIGPVVNETAVFISNGLNSLYAFNALLAGFIIATIWMILVMFGVHGPFMMILIMNIVNGTPDSIYAVISAHSFAVMGAIFAIWIKTKDMKLKSNALGSWITAFFGVTEPGIYGILVPRIKYFVVACIGSGLGGLYLAKMDIKAYQMAGMGIFRIPAFLEPGNVQYSVINVLIAYSISFVATAVATFILFKDDNKVLNQDNKSLNEDSAKVSQGNGEVYSPLNGQVIDLADVKDDAFASKVMGDGVAVIPSNGKVYAPFDGTVEMIFPTGHAVVLKSVDGIEILVHVGFDTVKLEGKYFEKCVNQGDRVTKGQEIIKFDLEALLKENYVVETPVVITNSTEYNYKIVKNNKVSNDDVLIKCTK